MTLRLGADKPADDMGLLSAAAKLDARQAAIGFRARQIFAAYRS